MSSGNGVIRIGRKGVKKFAFGEDGEVFSLDVVDAFQKWRVIDEKIREPYEDGSIPTSDMEAYYVAAVDFVKEVSEGKANDITTAEALDFIARLREQYDEVADFFRPKSREEQESPDSSAQELRFSVEPS